MHFSRKKACLSTIKLQLEMLPALPCTFPAHVPATPARAKLLWARPVRPTLQTVCRATAIDLDAGLTSTTADTHTQPLLLLLLQETMHE